MRILGVVLLILAAALICSPAGAQTSNHPLDGAPFSCDTSLLKQIAVQGINPAWTGKTIYSSPLIPSVGFATTDMASAIDPTVANYMNLYGIPGGAVAMTYNGKLIFAKSYGYVDEVNAVFTEPDNRFRVASVSKAITAMGIMKLVHDGRLSLDSHPFPFSGVGPIITGTPGNLYYAGPSNSENPNYNSQLSQITVNDLLHHAGGWSRDNPPTTVCCPTTPVDLTSYGTLQELTTFLSDVKGAPAGPPDCTTLMSFVESQPLQVTPPNKETHYSNLGFCALSEVIRETSGLNYLDYMTFNVFGPLGMLDTTLGATPQSGRLDRESVYYDLDTTGDAGDAPGPSLFPPYAVAPAPYSGIGALEALEGAGGIVSTAVDLALFGGAIASGKLPNLPGSSWPQTYYTDSSMMPGYECADPGSVMPLGTFPSSESCITLESLPYRM